MLTRYFGIDFGTTNIAVTSLLVDTDKRWAHSLIYSDNGLPFSSLVAINESEEPIYYGAEAKARSAELQDKGYTIVRSLKMKIGIEDTIPVGRKDIPITKIVSYLLQGIKEDVENNSKDEIKINRATVAVPVNFTNRQRKELMNAFKAKKVEIDVDKIVSEPMAAYISNREEVKGLSNVMVFDWGGGTLDISILNASKGKVNEMATLGWPIAGDRIDEEVAEYVHNRLMNEDKLEDKVQFSDLEDKDLINLLLECEQAKIAFSDGDEQYNISFVKYCGSRSVTLRLTVQEFNEIISPIVVKAIEKIDETLIKANMTVTDIHAMIMVGGSSNIPLLKGLISSKFPNKNHKVIYPKKPQWSVAEGAAIIESVNCGYKLNQDINLVLSGYNQTNNDVYPIIKKGTPIPYHGEDIGFGTVDDTKSANFIFGDDKDNLLGRVSLPSNGFLGETYYVRGDIDYTLVATITVSGIYKSEKIEPRVLEFNELSIYCDVSEIDDYIYERKG